MLIEKMNAIFPLCHRIFFQPFPIFSSNVHIATAENGTIMITFSMHSVVSFCSPFTVSQMPQPPMTSDKGFIQRLRFNRVRNRISEVTKARKNSFRKNTLSLNFRYHVTMAFFQPLPASVGSLLTTVSRLLHYQYYYILYANDGLRFHQMHTRQDHHFQCLFPVLN